MKFFTLCGVLLILVGCQQRADIAPVVEAHDSSIRASSQIYYTVKPHDTLYAIAFRYDKDYRLLAAVNHLYPPYRLSVGQRIRLQPVYQFPARARAYSPSLTSRVSQTARSISPQRKENKYRSSLEHLTWPTRQRKITTYFSPTAGKKGIDIAGQRGDKIFAAGSGVVAYAGGGLTGYGNLIIIKHNHRLLTAYGHNARNLVREGQFVHTGQVIAEMGTIDRRHWGLHFETRMGGKPVNPLSYLNVFHKP